MKLLNKTKAGFPEGFIIMLKALVAIVDSIVTILTLGQYYTAFYVKVVCWSIKRNAKKQ